MRTIHEIIATRRARWRMARRPLTQEQIAVVVAEAWSLPPNYRVTAPIVDPAKAKATAERSMFVYRATRRGWYATARPVPAPPRCPSFAQLTLLRKVPLQM